MNHWLRKAELLAGYTHIYMCTGDNGPDQVGTRNSLRSLFSNDDQFGWVLFFGLHCMKHAYHLACQSSLRTCDHIIEYGLRKSFRYYTSIATLSHTWRAHLSKIRAEWWAQHEHDPNVLKYRATFRAPPLALAGRWASIDGTLSTSLS